MMSLWDALRMNMMISYQELIRTFPKPFGRQKSLMTLCVAIFRVFPSFRFVVEGTARTLVKKRVSLSFANGAPMYIMRNRFSFAGFSPFKTLYDA